MKILIYLDWLMMSGNYVVAIELASMVRELGHDVVVFAKPGPLSDLVARRGLRLIPASMPGRRPHPRAMRQLDRILIQERPDLVHAYAEPPSTEAFYAAYLLRGIPILSTVFPTVSILPYLPRSIPLTVGSRHLQEETQRSRTGIVRLLEPPVDTEENTPDVDGTSFLQAYELTSSDFNFVIVSRLDRELKLEGVLTAIDAIGSLAQEGPVRLIIIGSGDSYEQVKERAEEVNKLLGRRVIVLTGQVLDVRAAYAAADVVLGMGHSIMRGMAFAKPSVVLGEQGFTEIVTPDTVSQFFESGFYGLGDGTPASERLRKQLKMLMSDGSLRRELGAFSHDLVCSKYSLKSWGSWLEGLYQEIVKGGAVRAAAIPDALATACRIFLFYLQRRKERLFGTSIKDRDARA